MEENTKLLFNEEVENVKCTFDGKLWHFESSEVDFNMIIPVKSISNVSLSKVRSWRWLIVLLLALIAAVAGSIWGDTRLYYVAGVLGVAAIVWLIFSVTYTVEIIPHSGIKQVIVTKKKKNLTNIYEALVNSLTENL